MKVPTHDSTSSQETSPCNVAGRGQCEGKGRMGNQVLEWGLGIGLGMRRWEFGYEKMEIGYEKMGDWV